MHNTYILIHNTFMEKLYMHTTTIHAYLTSVTNLPYVYYYN